MDREKAHVAKLEAILRDLEEKVNFSQQREVEHVKHIRALQEQLQTLESRLRAEDGKAQAEKVQLLEMLRVKSEEF